MIFLLSYINSWLKKLSIEGNYAKGCLKKTLREGFQEKPKEVEIKRRHDSR